MIRSEIRRLIRDGGLILVLLLALGLAAHITEYGDYLAPAMEIFLLLYASFTGWAAFERERQEGALEFLLALPIGRLHLLALKFLPRLGGVLLVYGVYYLIGAAWKPTFFLEPGQMFLFFIVFFLVSFSLSLSFRNFITAFALTALFSVGGSLLGFVIDNARPCAEIYRHANLPLLVVPLFFVWWFRRFDLRPLRRFNLRLLPPAFAAVVLIWLSVYLLTRNEWGCHFLTTAGDVIRTDSTHGEYTDWLTARGETRRLPGSMHLLREMDGRFYFERYLERNDKAVKEIVAMSSWDGPPRSIVSMEPGWVRDNGFYDCTGVVLDGTWYMLYLHREKRLAKVLAIHGQTVVESPLALPAATVPEFTLFHARPAPRRLYVADRSAVYEVDEAGHARQVYAAQGGNPRRERLEAAAWGDHLLTVDQGVARLSELDSGRLVYSRGDRVHLVRPGGGRIAEAINVTQNRMVLLRGGRELWLLDLETAQAHPLPSDLSPLVYRIVGDRMWLVDKSAGAMHLGIMNWRAGNMTVPLHWEPRLEWRRVGVFPYGIILWNSREYTVRRFAD